jgi:hypothetical protein
VTELADLFEIINTPVETRPGLIQKGMNTIIKCDRKDLELRVADHFVDGGLINQMPDLDAGYTDEIDVGGVLICQIQ